MKLIQGDHQRRIAIPGVPDPVRRPVDIDQTQTGFANLRTLRIYQFDAAVTIAGHAEEDEVFVVVMAGSVDLTVTEDGSGEESRRFTNPRLVYLPPRSAYQLRCNTDADVAYARSTPASGPPAKAFAPAGKVDGAGSTVLLEETAYAQRLRLRLVQINTGQEEMDFTPVQESEALCEALVHFRTVPTEGCAKIGSAALGTIPVASWGTVAIAPGDHPTVRIGVRSSIFALVVFAI